LVTKPLRERGECGETLRVSCRLRPSAVAAQYQRHLMLAASLTDQLELLLE
jgi:hypothetical protein